MIDISSKNIARFKMARLSWGMRPDPPVASIASHVCGPLWLYLSGADGSGLEGRFDLGFRARFSSPAGGSCLTLSLGRAVWCLPCARAGCVALPTDISRMAAVFAGLEQRVAIARPSRQQLWQSGWHRD